jgi:hypothetical protein
VIITRYALGSRTGLAARGSVYHDVAETARLLRKSKSWIYKQVAAGNLPHHRQGVSIYFTDGDIRDILAAAARPATKPKTRATSKNTGAKREPARPSVPAKPVEQPEQQRRLYVVGTTDIPQADPTASRKYRAGSA